jgi:hypothetical protein
VHAYESLAANGAALNGTVVGETDVEKTKDAKSELKCVLLFRFGLLLFGTFFSQQLPTLTLRVSFFVTNTHCRD